MLYDNMAMDGRPGDDVSLYNCTNVLSLVANYVACEIYSGPADNFW